MNLQTAIRHFEAQLQADGKSPRTRECYLGDLHRLVQTLGPDTAIRSITPHRLAQFVNSPRFSCTPSGHPKKPVSMNRSKTALRVFFKFLVDSDYLSRDPARLVRYAKLQLLPARAMSKAEVERLFAAIRKHRDPIARRDELMFRLMLGTGIRVGSLIALNTNDLDLKSGTMRIRAKGGVEQTVYLNAQLRRQLAQHISTLATDSDALFRSGNTRGIGRRQVQVRFSHWRDRAGLGKGYTAHCLRHTFATRLYQQTRDLHLVREALGHAGGRHYAAVRSHRQAHSPRRCHVCLSQVAPFLADPRLRVRLYSIHV
jgi:integrase/recombinase XerC